MGIVLGAGYYLGQQSMQGHTQAVTQRPSKHLSPHSPTPQQTAVEHNEAGFGLEGMIEKLQQKKAQKEKRQERAKAAVTPHRGKRPKLVIIIDDISQPWQLKALQALSYHITPSIFPPTAQAKRSYKLAYGLRHYMVHLPMQSGNAKMNRMQGMIRVDDTAKRIEKRIKEIRRLFPKARFINNHTGSRFTANYPAMKRLYGYLREEGFIFVDSRTTGSTKVKRIAKEYGDRYIVRDVFIDNTRRFPISTSSLQKRSKLLKNEAMRLP